MTLIKQKKIYFHTFGCRLNQSETASLINSVRQKGAQVTHKINEAEICVLNTCTVTARGDTDTRKLINKIIRLNPKARIAVIGCQAQTQSAILADLPNVRWVVGNADKMSLTDILKKGNRSKSAVIQRSEIKSDLFTIPAASINPRQTRANLKIQDGCDFFCAYCEIPFARGPARSRVLDDILNEAQYLADAGYQELVLTGVNTGTYSCRGKNLLDVVKSIEKIPQIKRIRISSLEPGMVDLDFFQFMKESEKLCHHLHMPIQSGSDAILKLMGRKYTIKKFCDFICHVRQIVPDINIGTDIIVGFPGETEQLFQETYQNLDQLPIGYFHVFSYSDRPYARSRTFPGHVTQSLIKEQSAKLRDLGRKKHDHFLDQQIGKIKTVLFEQKKDDFWTGLSGNYIRVFCKSPISLKNKIIPVRLMSRHESTILAHMTTK